MTKPGEYNVNEGKRKWAIRIGVEFGIYRFIVDYAKRMGMSKSSACRRLILIGAYCEANHGNQSLPASYDDIIGLYSPPKTSKRKDIWS